MKLLRITSFYPDYIRSFYASRPGLSGASWVEQQRALDYDAFGWADYWRCALTTLGYEVLEIPYNVEPLQRAWLREQTVSPDSPSDVREIALLRAARFQPDILWFDDPDELFLRRIREQAPSIRLVLGWTGSAIPESRVWKEMDLVLSCAQEAVDWLNRQGCRARQLHHGFDPRIPERLERRGKRYDFTFIGQLIRSSQFHNQREQLLERLAERCALTIFSPSAGFGWQRRLKVLFMTGAYDVMRGLRALGISDDAITAIPCLGKATRLPARPVAPVNPRLRPLIRPAVFGLAMFQALMDSRITLNIHADSSPRYASNMRLFETTGVGTCLVTDHRNNLAELFEPGKEVVTFASAEECVEKVTWLLDHPDEREAIAAAGQARTLRDHTFTRRAGLLDQIIREEFS